ncbi:MAG: hypothetical protein HYY18_09840 [Planctomycetes bacterium]|nr:hypothetical protein [Planctomycetota bacterium]
MTHANSDVPVLPESELKRRFWTIVGRTCTYGSFAIVILVVLSWMVWSGPGLRRHLNRVIPRGSSENDVLRELGEPQERIADPDEFARRRQAPRGATTGEVTWVYIGPMHTWKKVYVVFDADGRVRQIVINDA